MLAVVLALMALAGAMALVWPLLRRNDETPGRARFEAVLYRDQLDEVDRDRARGVIGESEAGDARAEIERRALAALERSSEAVPSRPARFGRALAMILAITLPAASGAFYFVLGNPDLPGQPHAAREVPPELSEEARRAGLQAMTAMVTERLAAEPRDPELWGLLARVNARLGRPGDTARLYREALAGAEPDSARAADIAVAYGEALVHEADGVVTTEAAAAFGDALERDSGNVAARFYRGLALMQSGEPEAALGLWIALEREAAADAPYLAMLRARIRDTAQRFGIDPAKLP